MFVSNRCAEWLFWGSNTITDDFIFLQQRVRWMAKNFSNGIRPQKYVYIHTYIYTTPKTPNAITGNFFFAATGEVDGIFGSVMVFDPTNMYVKTHTRPQKRRIPLLTIYFAATGEVDGILVVQVWMC